MQVVKVKPSVCYANGKRMIATHLNVQSVFDDLFTHVIFKYTLLDDNGQWAGESTYELDGIEQYSTWFATPSGAFEIVAAGIGLEIDSLEDNKVAFIEVA